MFALGSRLRREIGLLQTRVGDAAERRNEIKYTLADIARESRAREGAKLSVGHFVTEQTRQCRIKIRKGKIFEKVQPIDAFTVWIDQSVAEANHAVRAEQSGRFDEKKNVIARTERATGETKVKIRGVVVHEQIADV